jgi:hypothetical protein
MKLRMICVAAAALAWAGAAEAQRGPGGATLYELPNFQGRSVTITGSTPDLGDWRFNDRAQSARFQGTWRVCEHDDFRGRCQEIRGEVADLTSYGLSGQISSLEPAGRPGGGYGGGPGGGGWGPGGPRERGLEGTRTVFYPRPTIRGMDVVAGKFAADQYCRRQGLGPSVWFDSSERAQQAIGPNGEFVGRASVIRDLLCQKY